MMFSQKARTPEEKKPPPDAHAGPNADKSSLLVELPNSVNTKPQEENDHEEEEVEDAKSSDSSVWEVVGTLASCRKLADKEKDAAAEGFTAGTAKEEEAAGDAVREEEERGAEEEEEDAATTDGAQAEEKGAAQPPAAAPPPPEGAAKEAAEQGRRRSECSSTPYHGVADAAKFLIQRLSEEEKRPAQNLHQDDQVSPAAAVPSAEGPLTKCCWLQPSSVSAPPPHPPPKCPPPGDAVSEIIKSLDSKLYAAANAGWPLWLSDGQGGRRPKRPCHDFGCNALQDGARLDFNRGTAGDDLCNVQWNELLNRLPLYESVVRQQPKSMISRGNAVEQAIGLAYAAATNARYLNDGELDWTRTGSRTSSQSAWAQAWSCFQALGFGPDINLGPTFGLRAITVPKPPPPPLPADLDHPGGNNGAQAKPPPPLRDAVWLKPSSAAPPPLRHDHHQQLQSSLHNHRSSRHRLRQTLTPPAAHEQSRHQRFETPLSG